MVYIFIFVMNESKYVDIQGTWKMCGIVFPLIVWTCMKNTYIHIHILHMFGGILVVLLICLIDMNLYAIISWAWHCWTTAVWQLSDGPVFASNLIKNIRLMFDESHVGCLNDRFKSQLLTVYNMPTPLGYFIRKPFLIGYTSGLSLVVIIC